MRHTIKSLPARSARPRRQRVNSGRATVDAICADAVRRDEMPELRQAQSPRNWAVYPSAPPAV